jgi:endothelin-converting enzyme/putative endopeptidase
MDRYWPIVALLASPAAFSQALNYTPMELPKLAKFEASMVDASKDACVDFFEYACSKWISANPIPDDMPATSVTLPLFLYNQTILRNALEKAAANPKASGSERQIGGFWQSCMDESGRNANGKSWLQPHLKLIEGLKSRRDLARVLAYLHLNFPAPWQPDDNSTKSPLFGFGPIQDLEDSSRMVAGIDQGGIALPSREYYLDAENRYKDLRTRYVAHVRKMFQLAGDSAEEASAEAGTVLDIELALAKGLMDNVSRRDPQKIYNNRTLEELKSAVPDFQWEEYFKRTGAPAVPFYVVSAPGFLAAFEGQLRTRRTPEWKAYLRWWTIHRAAPYLGADFEQANFEYFGTALSGTPQMLPRWRRCVSAADRLLGEALGQAYVSIAFPADSKQRANRMVTQVREQLSEQIRSNDWMSPETKKQALVKQDSTLQKIGYPDKWRDYGAVRISRSNYLANLNSANEFEMRRQVAKIGQPIDRAEWLMTPATIDAYEDPQMNTINFPAGILQPPFFDGRQHEAANLGGIGMVIGHEAIHGFDDQGRKFDEKGNLRDWWTPEDARRYEEKDRCIVEQYSQDIPKYGVKQKGELTAGEDTADNGGLHMAMLALEASYRQQGKPVDAPEADGLTARQRFFLSYAFSWCSDVRPEAARNQVVTNPHSLPRFRVNRPLSNLPEFQRAFACKEGQPMVHTPQCRVW